MTFGVQPQNKPYQIYYIFITDKMCSRSHLYSHVTTVTQRPLLTYPLPSDPTAAVNLSVCQQSILLKMSNIPWGTEEKTGGHREKGSERPGRNEMQDHRVIIVTSLFCYSGAPSPRIVFGSVYGGLQRTLLSPCFKSRPWKELPMSDRACAMSLLLTSCHQH